MCRSLLVIEASSFDDRDRPIGLNNVGNICYLNSILQFFFSFETLRATVVNYKPLMSDCVQQKSTECIIIYSSSLYYEPRWRSF